MKSFLASCFCSLVFLLPLAHPSTPDYRVYITNDRYQADLIVYITNDRYQAKNSEVIWYMSSDKYSSDVSIKYTNSKYNSDLVIFVTKNKSEAGWKHNHPLQGKLNKK